MSTFGANWRSAGDAPTLAAKLGFQDPDRKRPEHDEIVLWLDGQLRDGGFRRRFFACDHMNCVVTWERPIGDRRWVAGFIDLYAVLRHPQAKYGRDSGIDLAFEVKASIGSLGDLVRQVRFYQAKIEGLPRDGYYDADLPDGGYSIGRRFYVVCPDNQYAETLRGQGIGFVVYPSGEVTHPASGDAA